MSQRKNALVLLSAVIALLLLVSCNTTAGQNSATSPPNASEADSQESTDNPAPNFELMIYQGEDALGGETVQFSEILAQDKPVVLNFWAGLCPPCRVEMPDFQRVYGQYNDEILLVGLDVGTFTGLGSPEEGRALLQELDITYPAGTTSDGQIMQEFGVVSMPSTYFITPEGEIFKSWAGLLDEEKMGEFVEELIAASEQS